MDIVSTQSTLLIAGLTVVTAFFVYSISTIRRIGLIAYFMKLSQLCRAIAAAFGKLLASLVALLAAGVKTAETMQESDIAPSGGLLNYRTSKLDDGTDPVGWYEKD